MLAALKFIEEVRTELSKVVWPTRKETIRLTLLVIVVSLVVGFFIGALDMVFVRIVDTILR